MLLNMRNKNLGLKRKKKILERKIKIKSNIKIINCVNFQFLSMVTDSKGIKLKLRFINKRKKKL